MSVSSLAPNTSWNTAPATNQSKAPTPTGNMSFANMSPKTGAPAPVAKPLVVSTSKPAEQHIASLGDNIKGQTTAVNNQATAKTNAPAPADDPLNQYGWARGSMDAKPKPQIGSGAMLGDDKGPGPDWINNGDGTWSHKTAGAGMDPNVNQGMTNSDGTQAPPPTTTPTAVPNTAPEGTTQTTGATTGATTTPTATGGTSSSNQPLTPEQQLADYDAQSDQAYADYTSKIQNIQNGTFPLNPTQQATINSIMSQFQGLVSAQKAANKNYTSAIGQANITSGRSRYAPTIASGEIQRSINAGISKLAEIETKASAALVEAQTAFQKEDYAMATDAYEMLQKHLDAKTETLTKMMDTASKAASEARKQEFEMYKFGVEQEQKGIENTLKFAEFDAERSQEAFENGMASQKFDYTAKQDMIKNMMESDKFDWQQKKDMLQQQLDNNKFALEGDKFTYQQEKDIKDRLFDIEKLEKADNPASYREWELSGKPGSYAQFLDRNKVGKEPTVDQAKAGSFAVSIKDANQVINDMQGDLFKGPLGGLFGENRLWSWAKFKEEQMKPVFLQKPEFQQFMQGAQMFVNAINRRESGAAISDVEWKLAFDRYLPTGGESEEVKLQKQKARDTALSNMMRESGPALGDDFKNNAFKKNYTDIVDFSKDYKDKKYNVDGKEVGIDGMIDHLGQANPNWNDDEVMQAIQALDDPNQKTEPLSMGENGSFAVAEPEKTEAIKSVKGQGEWGGQCGQFVHSIVSDYPYGLNSIAQKESAINVPKGEKPRVGDVVFQRLKGSNDRDYGHVAVVNSVNPDGTITLTESNYYDKTKPETVTNNRKVSLKNSTISGYYRGNLKSNLT